MFGLYSALQSLSFFFDFFLQVLERAERLRDIDGILLSAFVRLQELVIFARYLSIHYQ